MSQYCPNRSDILKSESHFDSSISDLDLSEYESASYPFSSDAGNSFKIAKSLLAIAINDDSRIDRHAILYAVLFALQRGTLGRLNDVYFFIQLRHLEPRPVFTGLKSLSERWAALKPYSLATDKRLAEALLKIIQVLEVVEELVQGSDRACIFTDADGEPSHPVSCNTVVDFVELHKFIVYVESVTNEYVDIFNRVHDEARCKRYTPDLNGDELRQLSLELPAKSTWGASKDYDTVKNKWKSTHGLSDAAFEQAVAFIDSHCEYAANIGNYSDFAFIDEAILCTLTKASRDLWSCEDDHGSFGGKYFEIRRNIFDGVRKLNLSKNQVCEVRAIYRMGKEASPFEEYDQELDYQQFYLEHANKEDVEQELFYVILKQSFIERMDYGLRRIGMPHMADRYCSKK